LTATSSPDETALHSALVFNGAWWAKMTEVTIGPASASTLVMQKAAWLTKAAAVIR